ncbi:pre-rRNA processing protein ftsj3 [Saguinus oedipus]|uniref:Pre-rRNA processing protein ftsj3 n=1 Tax=Saguinus oedipus TaxID=9490 RepID=A0ABQ9W5R4_SAGOE|nr:pre-rRNA processing protein ftsj3 [Saguinus oedipus]
MCCQDIRVLGSKELRSLLNWKTKLWQYVAKKLKEQAKALDIRLSSGEEDEGDENDSTAGITKQPSKEEEVEEQLNLTMAEMKAQEVEELKRKKKKLLHKQREQREHVELKMDLPGVFIADEGETGMFSLHTIRGHQLLQELTQGDMSAADTFLSRLPRDDIYVSDVEDNGDDTSLDSDLDPEMMLAGVRGHQGFRDQKAVCFAEVEDNKEEEEENPLLVPLEVKAVLQEEQANLWFSKGSFTGIEDDADKALEISQAQLLFESWQKEQQQQQPQPLTLSSSLKTERRFPFILCQEEAPKGTEASLGTEAATGPERKERMANETVIAVVAVRIKRAGDPSVKEVEHYLKCWWEINAPPIKKVAEAKARKKRRMLKLEQTRKKAKAMVNTVEISEQKKVAQLQSLYKKAWLGKEKCHVTYVVAKKDVCCKVHWPAGVRGHFKVMDSRMRKNQRAEQHKKQERKHKRK